MTRAWTRAAALVLAPAAATFSTQGCDVGQREGTIKFSYAPSTYDQTAADRELARCLALDGVQGTGPETTKLPPGISILFRGSEQELAAVTACVQDLTGVRFNGFKAR